MKVELNQAECIVTREPGDPKFYASAGWGSGESKLLYQVKKELIRQGYDVIKKRMWRDGHLVDDTEQYIRSRNGDMMIWYADHQIRFSYEDYNEGQVIYQVVRS